MADTATTCPVERHRVSGPAPQHDSPSPHLNPREHGAYAILGVPLVTALVMTRFPLTGGLIAMAAVAAFYSHEPLLILIGQRGRRVRNSTPQATRTLLSRLAVALSCGVLAFAQGSMEVRLFLAASLVIAGTEVILLFRGRSRDLLTQLVGIAGLTLPAAAIVAVDASAETALQFWLIWVTGRMATTSAIRATVTHHRTHAARWTLWACDGLLFACIAACGSGLTWHGSAWLVSVPLLISAVVLRVLIPHPRHLKRVGWTLLTVNIAAGLMMVVLHAA